MKILATVILSFMSGPFVFAASVEEVALYNKPDRQKILIEAARKETKITWYTSLIVDQVVRPVKEAFEKKYPFLQIEYFRGNSERLVQKMFAEYQGKRYEVDIVDGTVTAPMVNGNVLQTMGQEAGKAYLQKLKAQNVAKTTASNRQLLDLVIAGEYPIALHIFNHHAHISKTAGAPVDWYALEPASATINTI